ncbi:sigma-70 family RNA polymerase sigma factor [Clostridium sp. CF011]|uniref:sigma-70 family RNA polymerase sigma factor n=1 Tax=Clostridium sp. CF011 TaxID=2843318 RepID=UPI001C0C4C22|nr:sigma-70 family RNA polymerase sigma factor [Clostridium sp. CF011]MBU3091648.1 sigma-70 family RNA polymerase sigma factor [Clostridium sp. CF011]WAG69361.1 sigma-70 family RNA polymerase sigma factor [Clostridium sp. CF011]
MEKLVEKAKNKESGATEAIIEKFKYLIFKESSRYHIPGYELEDLVQHGYLSVIKAIDMYKLGSNSFNGYCINSIRMNFKALLKGQIKHFREVPNNEMLDFDTAGNYEFTLEDEVIGYDEVKKLYAALETLEPLERKMLERYYILGDSIGEIACDSDKSYHQFARIKKKALQKLKALM